MTLGEEGKAFFETEIDTAITMLVSSAMKLVLDILYKTSLKTNSDNTRVFLFENGCTRPFVLSKKKKYQPAKSLELFPHQLEQLGLVKGVNTIRYTVKSSHILHGTAASCTAKVFFWDSNVKLVISDIDGTITKSDTRGHLLALIGRDWTHKGIARLYTNISNSGYQFLYLTSRAIGQADNTRSYLATILQHNCRLPDGPVLMSPDRLFESLHREVIMKRPDIFKTSCLQNIQQLFEQNAFYAGFGNRITDVISYRNVSVPSSRIFIIDSQSQLKLELLKDFKSSYVDLNSIVHHMFPPPVNTAVRLSSQRKNNRNKESTCDYWHFSMLKTNSSNSSFRCFDDFGSKMLNLVS
jgi:phosphatidate phosphatase PAH1